MTAPTPTRVRIAPSPTGYFHVGTARTALYNWLVARQQDGRFLLRIEDTDRERSDERWTAGICDALDWLGLHWDEGPFRQSERGALYAEATGRLWAAGHLYACDCTREAVEARARPGAPPGYDGFCRVRGLERGPGRALRFAAPDEGVTVVHDLLRGPVEFAHEAIEDFVVVKSNGDPLFVLAVVVDDMDMGITHIIRGEEHLPTTPKAILLWEALGGPPVPRYAHLPLLVNERRQKLSKRRDRVAIEDYREAGFLPEAFVNYLALLGWSPGDDREMLTLDDLVAEFRLEEVSHSPAFFDEKRLLHFNGIYIRALALDAFIERIRPFLERDDVPWPEGAFDASQFERVAPLVQERVATLAEGPDLVAFLFAEPFQPEPDAVERAIGRDAEAPAILEAAIAGLEEASWDAASIRGVVEGIGERLGRRLGKVQAPVRVATMGRTVGLPLFESLEVLGRNRALGRLRATLGEVAAPR